MEHTDPAPVRCPSCDGIDVRRSWPKGLRDRIMIRFEKPPLRCRSCGRRFYRRIGPAETLGFPDPSPDRAPIL